MSSGNTRFPLRFNVGFLLNQPIGTSRDIHFEFPSLNLAEDFSVSDFKGLTRITRTPQGILVQMNVETSVHLECVRCLTEYVQPLQTVIDELYAFKPSAVTESNLILSDDSNINLAPLVREYLITELPIKSLCREDCKGLCTVCGEDLNVSTCEHESAGIKFDTA
ncbi:MAG TPA: DUF177 domain-containing protein [Anaerolineaceae bacterium]|nr:DUF177 domain-containing protein [Anaerolineaceae bacterium]